MAFSRSRLVFALAATATSGLAAGFATSSGGPVALEEELPEALAADDSCDATCDLSLRQLRGELRRAAVGSHEVDNGEIEDVPDPGDYPRGDEDGEEKTNMTVAVAGNNKLKTSGPLRGAFCCQNFQGLGYTNSNDIRGSCYASAKAEVGGYCDSPYHCGSKCNGTWVEGYCGYKSERNDPWLGAESPRSATYTAAETEASCSSAESVPGHRAFQDTSCSTEAGCAGCNGIWCLYVRTPEQH